MSLTSIDIKRLKELKLVALREGTTVKEIINRLIEEYLEKENESKNF